MEEKLELEKIEIEGLTAVEVWQELYNKELDCKKNILEYIDITKILKKQDINEDKITDTYNFIYDKIEKLKDVIKPNTMMNLKNNLRAQLGKYVKEKNPKPVNHFIEFFKQAYPENNRRKDFTWVLMDINTISEEQLWTTLTYINRESLNRNLRLNSIQKKDIVDVIKKYVGKNNVKFINDLRNLKHLTDLLNISIVSSGKIFKVKNKLSV